jgi:hypothetical protein
MLQLGGKEIMLAEILCYLGRQAMSRPNSEKRIVRNPYIKSTAWLGLNAIPVHPRPAGLHDHPSRCRRRPCFARRPPRRTSQIAPGFLKPTGGGAPMGLRRPIPACSRLRVRTPKRTIVPLSVDEVARFWSFSSGTSDRVRQNLFVGGINRSA